MESKMESADVATVECGEPRVECGEPAVECSEPEELSKEIVDVVAELSNGNVEIVAVVSPEKIADELSQENARLKLKVERLQAMLLASAAPPCGGTRPQARARNRRLSAPTPPAAIPEFEPVRFFSNAARHTSRG